MSGRPGAPCPNCGARLVAERPSSPRPEPEEPDPSFEVQIAERGRSPRRGRWAAGLATLALLAGVLAVRSWTPTERPAVVEAGAAVGAEPTAGRLVFVAGGEGDVARRLWVLDLASGTVRRGPAVGDAVDLVDLSQAHQGWLGVQVPGDHYAVRALALRGLDAGSSATALGQGELLAWGPGGTSLAVATRSRGAEGCRGVRIDLVTVRTGSVDRGRVATGVCGSLLTLGRSAVASYFSTETDGGVDTYFSGSVGVPHLLFGNTRMLSASPLAQFLVTAPAAGAEVGTDESLFLAWRGRGGPLPVRLGPEPLQPEAVVAWSPDGSEVALSGTVGGERGLYVVTAGSGSGIREPALASTGEVLDATFAEDGTLFVASRDGISSYRNGRSELLPLPEGVPSPDGPIVWLP